MKNLRLKLSLFVIFIIIISFLPNILDALNGNNSQENIPVKQEKGSITIKETDYTKGKVVFDRIKDTVCEKLDLCWITQKHKSDGNRILKKEFPTTWGNKSVLLIPKNEWIAISDREQQDLGAYLKHIGVDSIIVGKVKPAEYSDGSINPTRNIITVDETVWGSSN